MIKALPSSVTRATTVSDIFCRTLQQISSASIRTQIMNLWQNKLLNLQNKKSPATTPGIQQTIGENNVASKNFQCGLKLLHSKKKKKSESNYFTGEAHDIHFMQKQQNGRSSWYSYHPKATEPTREEAYNFEYQTHLILTYFSITMHHNSHKTWGWQRRQTWNGSYCHRSTSHYSKVLVGQTTLQL